MKNWILKTFFPKAVKANEEWRQCAASWSSERDRLTKELVHAQKLNLILAEKVTMRQPSAAIPDEMPDKPVSKSAGGHISWSRTRTRLEAEAVQS